MDANHGGARASSHSTVQSLRAESEAASERALWAAFRDASTPEARVSAWLAFQCHLTPGVAAGLVCVPRGEGGRLARAAEWPADSRPGHHLTSAAEQALRERRPLALQLEPQARESAGSEPRTCLAHPVDVDGDLVAVVALEIELRPPIELERALRRLAWGAVWLELGALRDADGAGRRGESLRSVLELLSSVVDQERFQAAATTLVTELASHLRCDRVSIGLVERGRVRLRAVSHTAVFDERANLTRSTEATLNEAIDQEGSILYPAARDDGPPVVRAHEQLVEVGDSGSILTVPFARGDRFCGALCLERDREDPWSELEVQLVETVADLVGPVLEVQRLEDRWLGAKALDALREMVTRLVGPRHVGLKLAAVALTLVVATMALLEGDYRVTADANLEARVLRAAVAPFDGYVAEAPVRAGDRVSEGDVLAVLDDQEHRLQRERWSSQLEQLVKQYRQAMAMRNAAEVEIAASQIEQARAQLALAESQLGKTRLLAPFDGLVVTGDLSQALGSPVARGDLLYEVAPVSAYRLVIGVDERDVDEIQREQRGSLVFSASPHRPVEFEVEQVTPVSTPEEGQNTFRVEARLINPPEGLRPGMEGVAKVVIDRRRLLWIWTHDASDWLRLSAWRWLP